LSAGHQGQLLVIAPPALVVELAISALPIQRVKGFPHVGQAHPLIVMHDT